MHTWWRGVTREAVILSGADSGSSVISVPVDHSRYPYCPGLFQSPAPGSRGEYSGGFDIRSERPRAARGVPGRYACTSAEGGRCSADLALKWPLQRAAPPELSCAVRKVRETRVEWVFLENVRPRHPSGWRAARKGKGTHGRACALASLKDEFIAANTAASRQTQTAPPHAMS